MNYNILLIPQFEKDIKRLSKKFKLIKKDLKKLIDELKENPIQGKSLGDNIYKIRLSNSSIPTGKSGGFRVITYLLDEQNNIYLLSIYSKTQQESITDIQLKELIDTIK